MTITLRKTDYGGRRQFFLEIGEIRAHSDDRRLLLDFYDGNAYLFTIPIPSEQFSMTCTVPLQPWEVLELRTAVTSGRDSAILVKISHLGNGPSFRAEKILLPLASVTQFRTAFGIE